MQSALPCKPNRKVYPRAPLCFKGTLDPNVIANQFNDYFGSIGSNLADNIICTKGKQPKHFPEKKISDSIYLKPATNNQILNQVTSFKNKAAGHDNIQPLFIKAARFVIAPYLNLVFNYIFTEGSFPSNCKIAIRVAPSTKSEQKLT